MDRAPARPAAGRTNRETERTIFETAGLETMNLETMNLETVNLETVNLDFHRFEFSGLDLAIRDRYGATVQSDSTAARSAPSTEPLPSRSAYEMRPAGTAPHAESTAARSAPSIR